MSVIDDYFLGVSPEYRAELERIRAIANEMLPGGQEVIFYGMPTIKLKGKAIISFNAHKNHIGIYPCSGHVISKIKELESYDTSAGTVRESLKKLLPKSLIQKIIQEKLNQIAESK